MTGEADTPQNLSLVPQLQRVIAGERLRGADMEKALGILISGKASPVQAGALLAALAQRGETAQEILAAATFLRARAQGFDAPEGAIDCCGTGGDMKGTPNISTAVAFVLAGCGVPVVKHGNRAASSLSGSADVLESLGVDVMGADMLALRKCLWKHNICFLMAPRFYPFLKNLAPVRKELGVRTLFNLLGPLLNPAAPKLQIIGVFDRKWLRPLAEVAGGMGADNVWVVHGEDGMDEITTTGLTHVASFHRGRVSEFTIHPHDAGIGVYKAEDLKGGTPAENAAALLRVLENAGGAVSDIVVLNAAAALVVAGKAQDLKAGAALARDALEQGRALQALESLRQATRKTSP